jgi:general secretion pathway protein G
MARRRPPEQHTFFPWERRGGFLRRFKVRKAGPFVGGALVLALVFVIGMRERRDTGVRRTRATILNVRSAVDDYQADHDGGCPTGFGALSEYRGTDDTPVDAWGKPLRLDCPGRARARYDLSSDGPDGKPGGLDRIE